MVRLRVLALAALLLAALLAFAPQAFAASAASPTAGKTVVVARVSGAVKVKLPGESRFSALTGERVVPLRTIVDALRGVVRLTSADGTGLFYQGVFQIFEPKAAPAGAGRGRITDLHLFGGNFTSCKRKLAAANAPAKPIRRLWGNAKGRFRTQGRFAAATVRGTKWLTADFCTSSAVTVAQGTVSVRDLVLDKTVIVPAGEKYAAEVKVAPANVVPPAITGTPSTGQTLTATTGTWTGTPAPTFAYQWQRCNAAGSGCTDIAGASGKTYVVQPGDAGATLRVRVTATNSAGSASATSAPTAVVVAGPANTAPPTISGTVALNATLTASPGTWTGTPAPTFAYQWQRCDPQGNNCIPIPGATSNTYSVQAADLGSALRVQVVATNSVGSATAVSAPTGAVTRPRISIGDVSMNEGNPSGQGVPSATSFVFTVTLSVAGSQVVRVSYATADDTAKVSDNDYTATSGTLTFNPGETSKTITVVVTGDGRPEPDERFFVNLSNPDNADLSDPQAIGTIVNDEVG